VEHHAVALLVQKVQDRFAAELAKRGDRVAEREQPPTFAHRFARPRQRIRQLRDLLGRIEHLFRGRIDAEPAAERREPVGKRRRLLQNRVGLAAGRADLQPGGVRHAPHLAWRQLTWIAEHEALKADFAHALQMPRESVSASKLVT
jgi:hypothetical protein